MPTVYVGGSRTSRCATGLVVAIAMATTQLVATPPAAATPEAAPESLRFEPSGIKGGGFYTSVALAPGPSDTVILAGGNSGYHRSTDLGETFTAHNRDLLTLPYMRVASVAYHPERPGLLFGATGSRGVNGGFARSLDDGRTWRVVSTEPRFAGQDNSSIADLPEHPRSTGSLIAAHDETVWAGTFDQGVMRSSDLGDSWEVVGLPGVYIRTLVQHPARPTELVVGTWRDGAHWTEDATAAEVIWRPMVGAPATVEEFGFVGDVLYAAAGTDGLYRFDDDGWTKLDQGVPAGSDWTAIAGVESDGEHLLFAGCYACAEDAEGHRATIIRSTDSGQSWRNVTRPENLRFEVVGSGERWAMADGVPPYMPDAPDAIVSQIALEAPDDDAGAAVVWWAGRGGLWRSTDSGTTWAPAVNGLSESNSEGLAVDPADPARVAQGAAHFGIQVSTDDFRTAHIDSFPLLEPLRGRSHPTAIRVTFDTATEPSHLIVAAGDAPGSGVGGVYLSADPWDREGWVDLGFTRDVPGKQPTSIAVGQDIDGQRVIVAAAQPRGGIVRKVGEGAWHPVKDGGAFTGKAPAKSDMAWVLGSASIYAFDPGSGLYRSSDHGRSFQAVWEHRSRQLGTGSIEVAPDGRTVYVAAEDGLYRLDHAHVGSVSSGDVAVVRLDARAIADASLDSEGWLWAVAHPGDGSPTTVLLFCDPSGSAEVIEYSDASLADTMVVPETLVVTDAGTVLVGGLRSGTLRGIPTVAGEPAITEAVAETRRAVAAEDLYFEPDIIEAEAGSLLQVELKNTGVQPHNISFYVEEGGELLGEERGVIIQGGETVVERLPVPGPGEYFFVCDIHPLEMFGALIVEEPEVAR